MVIQFLSLLFTIISTESPPVLSEESTRINWSIQPVDVVSNSSSFPMDGMHQGISSRSSHQPLVRTIREFPISLSFVEDNGTDLDAFTVERGDTRPIVMSVATTAYDIIFACLSLSAIVVWVR